MMPEKRRVPDAGGIVWMQTVSNFAGSPAEGIARPQVLRVPIPVHMNRFSLVLTNEYGRTPFVLERVAVASVAGVRTVTFAGADSCAIGTGERLSSDAIELDVQAGERLVVATVPAANQRAVTLGSAIDRTLVDGGALESVAALEDALAAHVAGAAGASALGGNARAFEQPSAQLFYYGLAAVRALDAAPTSTLCFFGDSLVNQGYLTGAVTRLACAQRPGLAACNCGISGNRLLRAGSGGSSWAPSFGRPGVERFAEDITFSGSLLPTAVFSLIGVNDLFQAEDSDELPGTEEIIAALDSLDEQATRLGCVLYRGTLAPFRGSVNRAKPAWNVSKERVRLAVNEYLRARPHTVDIDRIARDPVRPDRLAAAFDCGDHLHFSPQGGRLIGSQVYEALSAAL